MDKKTRQSLEEDINNALIVVITNSISKYSLKKKAGSSIKDMEDKGASKIVSQIADIVAAVIE